MWQIVEKENGLNIEDPQGTCIAQLPKTAAQHDNARLIAAAPALLSACQYDPNRPLPDALRRLAQMLQNLAQGPLHAPLDQIMRLTNDLKTWQEFLLDLADKLEGALQKAGMDPSG